MARSITVASLFAGGGGWEIGAQLLGWQPLWASELDPQIAACHDAALPATQVFVGDVRLLDPSLLAKVDVLCVSPPCQGHSIALHHKAKARKDERDDLLVGLEALRIAKALRPKAIVAENVREYQDSAAFPQLVAGLQALGYVVDARNVVCANYGVASTRQRLILRAVLRGPQDLAFPARELPQPTWDAALADLLPHLPPGAALAPWQARTLLSAPPPPGVDLLINGYSTTTAAKVLGEVRRAALSRADLPQRAWWPPGRPGPTMVASKAAMLGFRILRKDGSVARFTARCAARLQSFPDSYPLPDEGLAFKIIGNAVPPQLAARVLASLAPVLDGCSYLDSTQHLR